MPIWSTSATACGNCVTPTPSRIRGGFYIGDQESFLYYPMPGMEELETVHYAWWRSALSGYGA